MENTIQITVETVLGLITIEGIGKLEKHSLSYRVGCSEQCNKGTMCQDLVRCYCCYSCGLDLHRPETQTVETLTPQSFSMEGSSRQGVRS